MSLHYADKPWVKNYDQGVPETIDVPSYPVQYFLEEAARRVPGNTAVLFQDRAFTEM